MRLLRTIRLDPSDTFVFRKAAEPGEWAISGAFLFDGVDPDSLDAKGRAALRSGLLGIGSFGWSTLGVVTEITAPEREAAVTALAGWMETTLGAPDAETARAAAEEEIAFSASLCDHPVNTLVAVHRALEDGALRERFRTLTPRAEANLTMTDKGAFRAFEFVEVDGEDDEIVEEVDLAALMKDRS
jgi:hypothetical protein